MSSNLRSVPLPQRHGPRRAGLLKRRRSPEHGYPPDPPQAVRARSLRTGATPILEPDPLATRRRPGNRRWQPRRKSASQQTRSPPSQGQNAGSNPAGATTYSPYVPQFPAARTAGSRPPCAAGCRPGVQFVAFSPEEVGALALAAGMDVELPMVHGYGKCWPRPSRAARRMRPG